jgi:hypothetical protein
LPAAVAVALPATVALAPAPAEPTPIAKLWAKRQAIKKQYDLVHREIAELEKAVIRRAGKPDPLIRYSKDNDALGLEWVGRRRSNDTARGAYIWESDIERELGKIDVTLGLRGQTRPSAADRAVISKKQKRLKEMLPIARGYSQKVTKLSRTMGLDAANDRVEMLCNQSGNLESRIFKMPCVTASDLAIKLAIYDEYASDDTHMWAVGLIAAFRQYYPQSIEAVQS